MRQKLILHAGTHKTGTTTIQSILFQNREWLHKHGLLYPTYVSASAKPLITHHNLSRDISRGDGASAHRFMETIKRSTTPENTIILSSERFYRQVLGKGDWHALVEPDYLLRRDQFICALAQLLSDFDVKVLLFFRNYPDYFLPWIYKVLKRNDVLHMPFSDFAFTYSERFSYSNQVALFRRHFSSVETHSFETARAEGLAHYFFQAIGFPTPAGANDVWERKDGAPASKR